MINIVDWKSMNDIAEEFGRQENQNEPCSSSNNNKRDCDATIAMIVDWKSINDIAEEFLYTNSSSSIPASPIIPAVNLADENDDEIDNELRRGPRTNNVFPQHLFSGSTVGRPNGSFRHRYDMEIQILNQNRKRICTEPVNQEEQKTKNQTKKVSSSSSSSAATTTTTTNIDDNDSFDDHNYNGDENEDDAAQNINNISSDHGPNYEGFTITKTTKNNKKRRIVMIHYKKKDVQRWNENYTKLVEYQKEHCNDPETNRFKYYPSAEKRMKSVNTYYKTGRWVTSQIRYFKGGRMSDERRTKLHAMGFFGAQNQRFAQQPYSELCTRFGYCHHNSA